MQTNHLPAQTSANHEPRAKSQLGSAPNAEIVEAWNTVLFDKFCRYRHVFSHGLRPHGEQLMERYPVAEGARVLDIGCGFGDTTVELARRVGPEGTAAGVDCAANFIDLATREAKTAGVDNVSYSSADVQTDDLGGPYDLAFSRFGTMFFVSAVAALRNIKRSLVPGGQLTMVVWRRREDNSWLYRAEQCVREIVPENEHSDEVTCGPGPFSMSSPDRVSDQLVAAKYDQIRFERFDSEIRIGNTLAEAVEFAKDFGPAGEILRLAGDDAKHYEPRVIAALEEALRPLERTNGVWAPSSTWLISARAA